MFSQENISDLLQPVIDSGLLPAEQRSTAMVTLNRLDEPELDIPLFIEFWQKSGIESHIVVYHKYKEAKANGTFLPEPLVEIIPTQSKEIEHEEKPQLAKALAAQGFGEETIIALVNLQISQKVALFRAVDFYEAWLRERKEMEIYKFFDKVEQCFGGSFSRTWILRTFHVGELLWKLTETFHLKNDWLASSNTLHNFDFWLELYRLLPKNSLPHPEQKRGRPLEELAPIPLNLEPYIKKLIRNDQEILMLPQELKVVENMEKKEVQGFMVKQIQLDRKWQEQVQQGKVKIPRDPRRARKKIADLKAEIEKSKEYTLQLEEVVAAHQRLKDQERNRQRPRLE